jgi:AraC-like DNA-binding protein
LHVTNRYVQALFRDLSTTPSRYILDRRLELAAERLRSSPARRISGIAMAVGFGDFAYFSRAFHRRFGLSPRDYRAQYFPS